MSKQVYPYRAVPNLLERRLLDIEEQIDELRRAVVALTEQLNRYAPMAETTTATEAVDDAAMRPRTPQRSEPSDGTPVTS